MKKADAAYNRTLRIKLYSQAIADVLNKSLKQLTPDELEKAIKKGWSLVDFFKSQPPEKTFKFFQGIPSFALIMVGLSKNPKSTKLMVAELETIDRDVVLDLLAKKLPDHVSVIRKNPEWVTEEIAKLKTLL